MKKIYFDIAELLWGVVGALAQECRNGDKIDTPYKSELVGKLCMGIDILKRMGSSIPDKDRQATAEILERVKLRCPATAATKIFLNWKIVPDIIPLPSETAAEPATHRSHAAFFSEV